MYWAKVNTYWGVGLYAGKDLKEIASKAIADVGRGNVGSVVWATQEDVDWIAAMGGVVPKGAKVKPSAQAS